MRHRFLYWVLMFTSFRLLGQAHEEVKDLRMEWKVMEAGAWIDYQARQSPHRAVHFVLRESWRGSFIRIEADEWDIFFNGKLTTPSGNKAILSVDSLLSRYESNTLISVYVPNGVNGLKTQLIKWVPVFPWDNSRRDKIFFDDFVIISVLALLIFFVILFRTQTHLTLDYINVTKLFSFQSREEAITTGRIGSSANLFFFVFIALLGSLLFLVVLQEGAAAIPLSSRIMITTFWNTLTTWLLLAGLILVLLVVKLVIVLGLSSLFNFRDVVRFQFFNFVRSLYVALVGVGILAVAYFILGIEGPRFFYFLLVGTCVLLFINAFFLFFKLLTRVATSGFHLFSYLCGSEIIPLMILIKVLLF